MSRPCTCWRNIRSIKENVNQSHCPNLGAAMGTRYSSDYTVLWLVPCHRIGRTAEKWVQNFFTSEKCMTFSIQFLLVKKTIKMKKLTDELNPLLKKYWNEIVTNGIGIHHNSWSSVCRLVLKCHILLHSHYWCWQKVHFGVFSCKLLYM